MCRAELGGHGLPTQKNHITENKHPKANIWWLYAEQVESWVYRLWALQTKRPAFRPFCLTVKALKWTI